MSNVHDDTYFPGEPAAVALAAMGSERADPYTTPESAHHDRRYIRPNMEADAGTPWWNDRAIRYITEQLRPGDQVFEWGSGA